mmetsp:Transcript_5329/g.9698  ORF Transcript_5329/g.9698 Transcript_5329/m.9698 type:complete len:212 (-) Transcript_5329:237-872(-)
MAQTSWPIKGGRIGSRVSARATSTTPRSVDMQIWVASAQGWFRPCLMSQVRIVEVANSASSFEMPAVLQSQSRMVRERRDFPRPSPLSRTLPLTSSRALIVTLQRVRSLPAAVLVSTKSSSRILSPPPSSSQPLPTMISARAPQPPTLLLQSLLEASLQSASIVTLRLSLTTARPSAFPPVMLFHKSVICSLVWALGSWHALRSFGASFDR